MNKLARHFNIKIFGHVQGVSFRWVASKIAQNLDITGFIKNEIEGSVYIEAEGKREDLDEFIKWCRKGPDYAIVDEIIIEEGELKFFDSFEMKY